MIAACAALGANAPNGADEGSLSDFKRMASCCKSGACITGFSSGSNLPSVVPAKACVRRDDDGESRRLLLRPAAAQKPTEQPSPALARDEVDVADELGA